MILKDHHAEWFSSNKDKQNNGEQEISLAPACFFLVSLTSCSQASRYTKPSGYAFLRLSVCVCVCVCVCVRVCACMCAVTLFPWVCMPVSWILLLLDLVSSLRSCFPPSKTTIYTHSCSFFPASFSSKYYSYIFMLTRRLTYYTVWPIIYSTYMWTSLVSLPQIYMKNQFVNKITFLQQDIELAKKFICFPVTSQKNPNKLFGQPNN